MPVAKDHVTSTGSISTGNVNTVTSTTGNCSVVVFQPSSNGQAITSVTNSAGNTYVSAGPTATSAGSVEVWYAKNVAAGITTVTINWTGAATAVAHIYDLSGTDPTNPLAGYSFFTATHAATTNPVGPLLNVRDGGGIVIAAITHNGTAVSFPFILDSITTEVGAASLINSAGGTFIPSWTTASNAWTGITVAFKANPGVPLLIKNRNTVFSTGPLTISSTTAGNLIVVGLVGTGSMTISSITDNATGGTNTYTQCTNAYASASGVNLFQDFWYAKNCKAGATSITVNASAGAVAVIAAYEVSGADTLSPFDLGAHANSQTAGTSGPPFKMINPSMTINFPTEIIFSLISDQNSIIEPYVDSPFVVLESFALGYATVFAQVTYNASWDSNTSADPYCASLVSFTTPPQSLVAQNVLWQTVTG